MDDEDREPYYPVAADFGDVCPLCNGNGKGPDTRHDYGRNCEECNGKGYVVEPPRSGRTVHPRSGRAGM